MKLSSPPTRVVVVGAGLAGLRTCAALRERGYTGTITAVGAEGVPPYDRPPLPQELLSRPQPAWLAAELVADLLKLSYELHLPDPAVAQHPCATPIVDIASRT